MLKTALAVTLLCILPICAEARPAACVQTGDVMRPCAYQGDFLAGVKSIRVKMRREGHKQKNASRFPETSSHVNLTTGARPVGCPARRWCGCYMAAHLGISDRSLWVARNWARVGHAAPGPQAGAIVVWRHHVGLIRAAEGNRILVLSGNDGRAVRERWRSIRGVIAYRVTG